MPLPFLIIGMAAAAGLLSSPLVRSAVDNVFRDKVIPVRGSVVYCDKVSGIMEHSGIYVGHELIVHMGRSGDVEYVSPREFMEGTTAISIYVSCIDKRAVGYGAAADHAEESVGSTHDYSLLWNNCHIFCSECLTGRSNADTFLFMLKQTAEEVMGADSWRVWDIDSDDLF